MADRRDFIKSVLGLAALYGVSRTLTGCEDGGDLQHIKGSILGAAHGTGHLLRTPGKIPVPTEEMEVDVLIAGGGITGLSAMRWLGMNGVEDVVLLEMDEKVGGNSAYGRNHISAYPWAAHYLPIPDPANTELIDFLRSVGTITAIHDGLPVYNAYHICHDPEERLFINGHWQEGIIPVYGVPDADKKEIERFLNLVNELKDARGADGKYLFAIPVDDSSADEEYRRLDKISFYQWLTQQGFSSSYLLWYLLYCCKDDYGASLQETSAWAGLHYFASRRGAGTNVHASDVLTWPQGNGFLMEGLRRQCKGRTVTGAMAYRVEPQDDGVLVHAYRPQTRSSVAIRARKVLLATPQYVNKRILAPGLRATDELYAQVQYAPWVVANISFAHLPEGRGAPLSWDNVLYGKESVGYVYANHQDLSQHMGGVITWYLPLTGQDPTAARHSVYDKDIAYWKKYIIDELSMAHPGIASSISNIDVWVWGHGMIMPSPGYIWGGARARGMQPVGSGIHFAHTDLSGISIFEEAFYQGIRAARRIIES